MDGMGAKNSMRMMRTSALPILLLLALLGCDHSSDQGTGSDRVRIAIHREPIAFLPVRVSQDLGYYRQEHLRVEMSEVSGGSKAMEALLGGSVDVAASSVSDVILLASQGHPVRCFFVLYTRPIVALTVAPGLSGKIKSIRDLKGHTVGVSSPGSASHQFLNFLLASNGVSPHDVSIVSVGMSSSSIAALESGKVDAGVLIASAVTNFENRHPGTRFLADTRTPAGAQSAFGSDAFPSLALIAEDTWLQQHGETAKRLVRAVREGLIWMRETNVERIREAIPEAARMNNAESDYKAIRDAQQVISPDGLMPAEAPQTIVRVLMASDERVAHVNVAQLYTNEFASAK